MPEEVVVLGTGAVTAVGLTAAETDASVRSATSRFQQIDWLDRRFEPFTVAEIPEAALPLLETDLDKERSLTVRDSRLLRLAAAALQESLESAGLGKERLPIWVGLPEAERARPVVHREFLRWLGVQTAGVFDVAASTVVSKGRAAGLLALGQAIEMVGAGRVPYAAAGGVDTYRDLYTLATLDLTGRVNSSEHLDGFIPGEGAAFVILGARREAEIRKLRVLARVSHVAADFESGHLHSEKPYRGDGLASAVSALLARETSTPPIHQVFSSMNGESHWAREWGVAYLRNRPAFGDEVEMVHPADCFGDAGAAAGPLLLCLAAMRAAREAAPSRRLVYASSDHGERAALTVRSGGG